MDIIMIFVETLGLLFFYNVFLKNTYKGKSLSVYNQWKKYVFLASLSTGVFFVFSTKVGISSVIILIFILLIYIFALTKINRTNLSISVIFVFISTILAFLSEVPPTILALSMFKDKDVPLPFFMVLIILMIVLNVFLLDKLLKRRGEMFVKIIEKYNWISLIILNCFIFFLFIKTLLIYNLLNTQILIQISIMSIVLILSNIAYIINLYKNRQKEKEIQIKTNINPLIDELLNKMKAREHEYKNHLNILYCMIQVCKHDELRDRAKAYIGNITEDNLLSKVSTIDNTIVKAILFSKLREAEKQEIDYKIEIESNLSNISLDDSELTIILSNLLNNAIEATSETENKKLSIYIGEEEEQHIIKVKNSTKEINEDTLGSIFKEGFSTKGDDRGYGLYNIKSIVDKYKGKIKLSLKDDMLEFHISV